MKSHFMIDLETMGIRPTSAIISIGIALFNQDTIIDTFYSPVSLQSCLLAGLTTDKSTEDWWAKQSVEARAAWQVEDAPTLPAVLSKMTAWMRSHSSQKESCPWGNGADFDLILLKNAFNAIDADPPWEFYNHHCFRTMKNMFTVGPQPRSGTHHNALDDAISQTHHLHRILTVHKLTLT